MALRLPWRAKRARSLGNDQHPVAKKGKLSAAFQVRPTVQRSSSRGSAALTCRARAIAAAPSGAPPRRAAPTAPAATAAAAAGSERSPWRSGPGAAGEAAGPEEAGREGAAPAPPTGPGRPAVPAEPGLQAGAWPSGGAFAPSPPPSEGKQP